MNKVNEEQNFIIKYICTEKSVSKRETRYLNLNLKEFEVTFTRMKSLQTYKLIKSKIPQSLYHVTKSLPNQTNILSTSKKYPGRLCYFQPKVYTTRKLEDTVLDLFDKKYLLIYKAFKIPE